VDVATIGEVTAAAPDGPRMVLLFGGEVVADLAIAPLVDEAPVYERPRTDPMPVAPREGAIDLSGAPSDREALLALLASPNLCSKLWITRQYDSSVRTNTVAGPGGDAAILRVKGTPKGLAITADVNPRWVAADPYRGAAHAVAESALNVACAGAAPIGVTDCLNFGNPERPEVLGQLAAAVKGIAVACRLLETPVVSGNVSLYNETEGRSILPTPTIGMVGLLEDVTRAVGIHFRKEGDVIALLGETKDELGASEYLATVLGREEGPCPTLDLLAARSIVTLLVELTRDGLLSSAHDVAEGGLAVALAECASGASALGAQVNVQTALLPTLLLFSESAHRAVVSFEPGRERQVLEAAKKHGVPTSLVGRVAAGSLDVSVNGEPALRLGLDEIRNVREASFVKLMEETV
jgi:phosphoribosylformylglycinamidine synthase